MGTSLNRAANEIIVLKVVVDTDKTVVLAITYVVFVVAVLAYRIHGIEFFNVLTAAAAAANAFAIFVGS